ncbi:proliferation marker protein Ki-67 isoform X3 [Sparus aurata]|uniref:proliferation marker protein Ki-67 isoform X3 n=1 Tax=Sparus aurata TaxID=8175 RepID=UPI0011C196B2|nr:proliferation marker protein Ki-67-like isoform X3 [Sparus aurata]
MPLHGKIVVIKRSGGDGTEFPLTATCLFGRKPDCDIRIQLPQVSKEHCRIDLNENKEVVLTNLSSVNPTCVNGEALQQSERLKHGDVITIIDRSFRFEYPPAPTPKKRSSIGGKTETLKVLKDQQVGHTVTTETGGKRISEVSTGPHLKDGTNNDNIQRSLEKNVEVDPKEDHSLLHNKTASPFNDLYQMIKKSLDVKTPRKSSVSLLQTPSSKLCTPKPVSVRKSGGKPVISSEDKSTPKDEVSSGADETKEVEEKMGNGTPKSVKKQRKSFEVPSTVMGGPEAGNGAKSEAVSPQKRNRSPPQRFTACEVIEQVSTQTPKSPVRRRSKEATPAKPAVSKEQEKQAVTSPKTKASPKNSGKVEKVKETSKKRKSGELVADLPTSQMKRKRVSFGGQLSPELFDKRLPPDSPLRKGATPRRSLSLYRPKNSLLRRASVIGLLQEHPSPKKSPGAKKASPKTPSPAKKSPESKSPSPKAETPAKKSPKSKSPSPKPETPAKKSPKSKSPSPKPETPAKKSPKSKSPSPKPETPAKKSPKSKSPSPKAATPAQKSPKSRSPTPKAASANKMETPKAIKQTPTVQGRFSVSRISTPSPIAEDAVTDQVPLVTVTPKIPLMRKSMKNTSRKSIAKSAVKVLRRSGISRASIKAMNSYADMVKFGQTKVQVAIPAKTAVPKKTMKKTVSKLQTPARKLLGHVSTGHANSPVTIVVGRAHKQKVVQPTGAAPRLVTNIVPLKKNMKMDEDLTGLSEMYKTPLNVRKRRSVISENNAMKTPAGALGTSVVEPSVLNTPEEPDEMMVSPMSTVKDGMYNSEAVRRLLDGDQECSLVCDVPADCPREQEYTDVKTTSVTTPKQKPELPEGLTGVKRITKTPRMKAEPVEDLRGRLLKTPKQKPEQQECLTGVKRLMKTPRQKAEPVEDLRGRLLKTPRQKPEQQECLTGVKRLMKTPRQKAEPVEDLRGNVLKTPKQKPKVQECLTGVKQIFETPQWQTEPLKDVHGKLVTTPKAPEAVEVVDAPVHMEESEDPSDMTDTMTPCLQSASLPVSAEQLETKEVVEQNPLDCGLDVAKELDFAREEPQDDVTDGVPQVEMEKEADTNDVVDDHSEEVPIKHDNESSEATKTISQATVDENVPVEEPKMDTADEAVPEEPTVVAADEAAPEEPTVVAVDEAAPEEPTVVAVDEAAPEEPTVVAVDEAAPEEPTVVAVDEAAPEEPTVVAVDEAAPEEPTVVAVDEAAPEEQPKLEKKSVRGRRVKTVESKMEDKQETAEHTEDPVIPAPVRGRRGKKTEATAPPAVRQTTQGRNAKTTESREVEPATEESLPSKIAAKPKRGRNAKKASDDQAEIVEEIAIETKAPSAKCLPEGETATCKDPETDAAIVQKKSVGGRRAKVVESKPAEDKQEVPEHPEDPVVSAPVRGRRGKKTEVAAPPTFRQTTRGRNAKSQECTSDVQSEMEPEKAVETPVTDISTEAESDQTSIENTHQEEIDSAPPAEEVVVKPVRGRKAKQIPVEPLQPEPEKVVSEEHLTTDAEPQKSTPAVGKPRRGRKTKADTVEQNEVEEHGVTVETKQESQPPVRAKRGRNARPEEEKLENDKTTLVETTKSQEPVKKGRRTRKTEQDYEETSEEVQTTEKVVPEEAEAPVVAEPEKMIEQAAVAAKPRRGGRKAKQDTESETPVESAEVQEVPAASATDKPKRGRRGKQVAEEVEVTAVVPDGKPDLELETEEKSNVEPDAPVVKASRARGAKKEVSQVIPAKRARRGAAPPSEDNNAESTTLMSESAPTSIEPTKRGRRAAAKPTADDAKVTSEQAEPIENSSSAVEEDTKSKRSVKWKTGVEVFEIPNPTPVKAVRGRKSKLGDHVDTDSQNVSKDASKTEEKDLSETVVKAQPAKRARRGAKIAIVAADKEESTSEIPIVEAETQPKTRRGRSAKK